MDRSDVFLSYRRKDVDFVKLVDQALKKSGREVWVDWEDIPPGVEGFADEIQKGIEGADAFIAVLSPSYLESEYCLMELREALRLKKRIVPIVYLKFEPAPPPEGIGHINWVYFTPHAGQDNGFDDAFPKVLQALEADYEHAREHTRLLLRAIDWDKHSRNVSYLLKGAEIEKAESWHVAGASKDPSPTEMQGEFILLSRKQQRRQQQMFTGVIGIFLVLAAIAAVFALFQASEARRQEALAVAAEAEAVKNAEIIHSNALTSAALLPGNEEIAVALALEATRSQNAPADVFETLKNVAYPPGSLRYALHIPDDYAAFKYPAVSPDGRFLVLKNKMYDLATGEIVRTFDNVPGYVLTAVYLPDGKEVIIAGDDDGVKDPKAHPVFMGRYDTATGELLQEYDTGMGVGDIQLSGDGKTLISYMPDHTAIWWDVATGAKIRQFDDANGGADVTYRLTNTLRFSPDLRFMAQIVIAEDGSETEVMKNTETLEPVFSFPLTEYNDFQIFSPDSSQIAIGLSTYSVADGQLLQSFEGPFSVVYSLRFSPDGSTLMASTLTDGVFVWDMYGNLITHQTAHAAGLLYADYTAAGDRALSFDVDGGILEWDLRSGNLDSSRLTDTGIVSPDGRYSVDVLSDENYQVTSVVVTDTQTTTEVARVPLSNYPRVYFGQTLDDARVVYQSGDPSDPNAPVKVVIASLTTGATIAQLPMNVGERVTDIWLLPDHQRILLSKNNDPTDDNGNGVRHLELREITSNKVLLEYVEAFTGYMTTRISPDFTHMLIAEGYTVPGTPGSKSTTRMVDVETGQTLFTWYDQLTYWWFTPDSQQFLTPRAIGADMGGNNMQLELHDAQTGELVHELAEGRMPVPGAIVFAPDGSSFFTGIAVGGSFSQRELPSKIFVNYIPSVTSNVAQWDMATGRLMRKYPLTTDLINLVADGKFLLTLDYNREDATEYRWRLDTPQELVAWACANRYVAPLTTEQREKYSITSETSVCANLSASS